MLSCETPKYTLNAENESYLVVFYFWMVPVTSARLPSWNGLTLSPNLSRWFFPDPFMEKRAKSPSICRNKHALVVVRVTRMINSTLAPHEEYQLVKEIRPSSPDRVKMLN